MATHARPPIAAAPRPANPPSPPATPAAVAPPDARPAGQTRVGAPLAQALLDAGHVTTEQLQFARRVHLKVQGTRSLTSVMLELRHVTEHQVRTVLRAGGIRAPLGEMLVELGLLEPHDLTIALGLQRTRPGVPLGEILIENHFVTETQVLDVLADMLAFPHVQLDATPLDPHLVRRAPVKLYRTHEFVPVRHDGGRVLVAFADPLNRRHVEVARSQFGTDIVVGIASRKAVMAAVTRAEREVANALGGGTTENATVALVNHIIGQALAQRVSDIHFEPQRDRLRVRFRQDGVLVPYEDIPLDQAPALISRIKVMAGADIAERRRHQDGRIEFETSRGTVDLRVSFFVTIHGEKVVLRILNNRETVLAVRDIGMAPKMLEALQRDVLDSPSGVVIVTGPTGSGKTTTLYGAVNYLNDSKTSIITAEDPVEYMIDGVSQCSINPKINVSYIETLKHIVRQDPDVIVIGEIRDQFSAEVAINAALTGHKVLTTFHTEDSIGGLVRLLNMNIEAFLISSTVVSVVAQRLLRRVCPRCAEPHVLSPGELALLGYNAAVEGGLTFQRGRGCAACHHVGYSGRVAVFELLVLNEMVRDAVLARRSAYEIRRVCLETSGLVTLLEDAIAKAAAGVTSFEEIIRMVPRLSKPRPVAEVQRLLGLQE